jgi:hypothetical protein
VIAVSIMQTLHTGSVLTGPQLLTADLARYKAGEFAQDCFPYLNAAQREFLISGISGESWDEMFPEEDEDAD